MLLADTRIIGGKLTSVLGSGLIVLSLEKTHYVQIKT